MRVSPKQGKTVVFHTFSRGKLQTGLKQDRAVELSHFLRQLVSPVPAGGLWVPTSCWEEDLRPAWSLSTCSRVFSWAFRQSAGSSLLTMLDFLRSHGWQNQVAHSRLFSEPFWGAARRNTGLRHLPASAGTVPSCCKVGCWSSEMNPTDILKQIGLVGVASEMNDLLNPPWKEKEGATSLQVPPFPDRNDHLSEGWVVSRWVAQLKPPPVWSAQPIPMKTCTRSRSCGYNPGRLTLMLS